MSINTDISSLYPAPENSVYLDTPSFGMTSVPSKRIAMEFLDQQQRQGSRFVDKFRLEELPRIREVVLEFLDAADNELAFIPNFSFGLTAVLASLQGLRRVLLYKDDYPSLVQPFLLNDYEVSWIEGDHQDAFTLDELKQSIIKNEIQLVAISQVQWLTGVDIDVEELGKFCRERGVILLVDGTQSLGDIPFSFNKSQCHIYLASNYKWMNAGHGTGILCIKHDIIDRFPPMVGGFNSYQLIDDVWQYASSIHSYEPGHLNFLGLALLRDAVKDKLKLGMHNIHAHNQKLKKRLVSQLFDTQFKIRGSFDPDNRSGFLCIQGDQGLADYLSEHGIICRMRQNIIRFGMHFHNTQQDVERLVDLLLGYKKH